jgi:hypothetical protein
VSDLVVSVKNPLTEPLLQLKREVVQQEYFDDSKRKPDIHHKPVVI